MSDAEFVACWHYLRFDHSVEHRVLRLVADDPVESHVGGDPRGFANLARRPLRHPDVERLALTNKIVEGAQGLLERGAVVVAVCLVEVHVVGLQASKRGLARLHDVFARQATIVHTRSGGPVDLREDLHSLASLAAKCCTHDLFGSGAGIDVRSVERRDSRIQCGVDRRVRGGVVDLRAVRNPVAVSQGADLQSTAPEVPKFHDHEP